jgi:hypothetical protein
VVYEIIFRQREMIVNILLYILEIIDSCVLSFFL